MMKGFLKLFFLLFLFSWSSIFAQVQQDIPETDSIPLHDSGLTIKPHINSVTDILKKNKFFNLSATPVTIIIKEKNTGGKDFLFYLLSIVIFLFAVCKAFYTKYFNNIFKVFFNTSLRQNQLTDLLLQAKLPSLIFNSFFAISAGLYAWLLISYYKIPVTYNPYLVMLLSVFFIAIVYIVKFIALKFVGWLSGMSDAVNQYIFVLFLINKIIGILLLPFIVLLAFAPQGWQNIIIISSFIILGIFFLLRYLRSFSLLQNKLKVNGLHFLIYITGLEILPVLLLYKLITNFAQ